MEIGIKGMDDLFTGNVVCNGHYFELACPVVYRRWDGRVARTFGGMCSEIGSSAAEALQRSYLVLQHIEPNTHLHSRPPRPCL
jgi:hypothetical protein